MTQTFWNEMELTSRHLSQRVKDGRIREVFSNINTLLLNQGYNVIFDITSDGCDAILTFSAEGNCDSALLIDKLCTNIPQIEGWKIFRRRQRKDINDARVITEHIYGADANEGRYVVSLLDGRFSILVCHPIFAKWNEDVRTGFVDTLFEYALGEEFVEKRVARIATTVRGSELKNSLDLESCVTFLLSQSNLPDWAENEEADAADKE